MAQETIYTKNIYVTEMSNDNNKKYLFHSLSELSKALNISAYRVRDLRNNKCSEDYVRSIDGKLYHVEIAKYPIIRLRPDVLAYSECEFENLHIASRTMRWSYKTLWKRYRECEETDSFGIEQKRPLNDKVRNIKWYVTFLKIPDAYVEYNETDDFREE